MTAEALLKVLSPVAKIAGQLAQYDSLCNQCQGENDFLISAEALEFLTLFAIAVLRVRAVKLDGVGEAQPWYSRWLEGRLEGKVYAVVVEN